MQVTFFAYDWFSAVRTPMMRHILYDTFIPVSPCDLLSTYGLSTAQKCSATVEK